MKRRIISNFLCALLIMINVLNQPFGIVHAEEIEKIYDYTVLALSSDEDSFVMDVAGGNINGNVASISSFELPNVNIIGRKDEKVEVDFSNLLSAIDERYFTNAVIYESSEECLYNVNESNNSLINIAQIRVLGEQEYYEYVKNEGLLANLINYVNGLSEVRDIINHSITKVSEKMDLLGLKAYMSEKIIYSVN